MPKWLPMWVSELHCRPEIREKLIADHDTTFEAVRAALVGQTGLRFRPSPTHADRRECFLPNAGRPNFIVLAKHEHLVDEYWLVTAYQKTAP